MGNASRLLVGIGAGCIAAVVVGWIGAMLNLTGRAPLGLIPLGMGVALGAILGGLGARQRVARSGRLIAAAALLAILGAAAEHAWLYRDFRQQWQEARVASAELAKHRPEEPWSPAEYFRRELGDSPIGVLAYWAFDAALIVAGAVGVVVAWPRHSD